ncbi:hypothetical protein, partial [Hoeflea sp.]|uniref:hypothetical protein n=1 Tax=Hoeflea sp. TaxID=1940281 RepID=UPI002B00002B
MRWRFRIRPRLALNRKRIQIATGFWPESKTRGYDYPARLARSNPPRQSRVGLKPIAIYVYGASETGITSRRSAKLQKPMSNRRNTPNESVYWSLEPWAVIGD